MKSKEEIKQLAEQKYKYSGDVYMAELVQTKRVHFTKGYLQCQENMAEKKYTEEDLRKALKYGIELEAHIESFDYKNYPDGFSQFINSLNKQD